MRIRIQRRILSLTSLAVLLCCLLILSSAGAAENRTLRLSAETGEDVLFLRSLSRGYDALLCAPGSWDLSQVCLSMENREMLYLGDEKMPVPAVEKTDLTPFLDKRVPVFDERGAKLTTLRLMQGSSLTTLFLTVDSKELAAVQKSKDNEIASGRAVILSEEGETVYDGEIQKLKGRGNSTFAYAKKPYELKLKEKASPAGMPAAKTWILLANYADLSLLRNQIVLDTAWEIGLPCAVRCAQVDVWINGEYQGLYLLAEKVQIGKNRVNIRDLEKENERLNPGDLSAFPRYKKPWGRLTDTRGYLLPQDPEDITGGYIAKIEKDHRLNNTAKPGFETESRLTVRIVEPTCPSENEVHYFASRVDEAQRALISGDGVNPETGKDWREYWDQESFARKFLLEEWCKNFDFLGGSQYFYKDSDTVDPLLYAGPAWDYDLSCGNMTSRGFEPSGRYMTSQSRRPGNLYWLFSEQESFRQKTREVWRDVFAPAMDLLLGESGEEGESGSDPAADGTQDAAPAERHVLKSFSAYTEAIRASAAMNFARWGTKVVAAKEAGSNFDTAVAYLGKWLRARVAYMNNAANE